MTLNPSAASFHPLNPSAVSFQPPIRILQRNQPINNEAFIHELLQLNPNMQAQRCSSLDTQSLDGILQALLNDTAHPVMEKLILYANIVNSFIFSQRIERLAEVVVSSGEHDFTAVAINLFVHACPTPEFAKHYKLFINKMIASPLHVKGTPIPALLLLLRTASEVHPWFQELLFDALAIDRSQATSLGKEEFFENEETRNFVLHTLPSAALCRLLRGNPELPFDFMRAARLTQQWFKLEKRPQERSLLIQKFLKGIVKDEVQLVSCLTDHHIKDYLYGLAQYNEGVAVSYVFLHMPITLFGYLKFNKSQVFQNTILSKATVSSQDEMFFMLGEMGKQPGVNRAEIILNFANITIDPAYAQYLRVIPLFLIGLAVNDVELSQRLIPLAQYLSDEQLKIIAFALPLLKWREVVEALEKVLRDKQFDLILQHLPPIHLNSYLNTQVYKLSCDLVEVKNLVQLLEQSLNEVDGKKLLTILRQFQGSKINRLKCVAQGLVPRECLSITNKLDQLRVEANTRYQFLIQGQNPLISQLACKYPNLEKK